MNKRLCLAMVLVSLVSLVCLMCLMSASAMAVPSLINYQGKLTNTSDCVLTGTYQIQFLLYETETGGTALWDEVQSTNVDNGLFTAHLGAVASFPIGLFENDSLYLETVILNPDTGLWETFFPRQRMTSTAYALKADHAATAGDADTLDGKHASELIVPETDPTVPANLKDGVSWSEIADIPPDVADGDQVGITTETDPKVASTTANSIPKWNGSQLVDSSAIVEDGSARVGIGITPSEKLDVAGNIQATGTIKAGNSIIIDGVNDKITASSGTISFDDDNIATAGIIQSTSGGFKFPDGTVQVTAATGGCGGGAGGIDWYTKLLLHMDDTGLTDRSPSTHTVTLNGNVIRSDTQSQLGGYSAYFDGEGDYLSVPDSEDWDFGVMDFTIDMWINIDDFTTDHVLVQSSTGAYVGWSFILYSGGKIHFVGGDGGAWNTSVQTTNPVITSTNTWYHVALVRVNSLMYLYVNGIQKDTDGSIASAVINGDTELHIGDWANVPAWLMKGYIDELRISKGIARWTSNFTPPSAPYNAIGEIDPTVPANLKDGVSWSEVANIPADIADGDQVGITAEQDPKVGSTTANSIPKWDGTTGKLVDSSSIVEDGSGNVGIGTTSPEYKLHIASDVFFKQTGNSPYLQFYKYDGTNTVHIASNGDSYFNGGNVGIGTTPAFKLDVNGIINATDIYKNGIPFSGSSQWDNVTGGINYAGGRVGIGTTNPMNATLEVKTDQHTYLRLRSDTLNNYDKALVYKDSGGDRWAIGMGSNFGFENPSPFLADFQIGFNPNNNLIGDNWTTWLNRFIIKTNGNVGIGTASPSQKLEVAGIVNAQGFYINGSPFAGGGSQWTTSGSYIYYNAGNVGIGTTSPVANLQVNGRSILLRGANENVLHFCLDGTNGDGYFGIKDSQDGSNCLISDNQADVGDLVIRSENRTMRFSADSGNTAHMSIQSSGNVGIGTTNPSYKLHINGVACAASFVSASDLRLKENINPLTNAIGKVSALHGIYFNFKVEPPSKRQVGVIAQEVEAVLPEAIFEDAEGYKSVDYSKLTPLLIEAVKELKAELKAQDKAKQAQIEALKALVCQDHPEAEICQ